MKITELVSDGDRWTSEKADRMAKLALECAETAVKHVLQDLVHNIPLTEEQFNTLLTDFIIVFAQTAVFLNLDDTTKELKCRDFDDAKDVYEIIVKGNIDNFDKINEPTDDCVTKDFYISALYGLDECGLLEYTNGKSLFDWLILNEIRATTVYALGIAFIRRLYHLKVLDMNKQPKSEDLMIINLGVNKISEIVGTFFPFPLLIDNSKGVVLVRSTFCVELSNNMFDQYETVGDKFYKIGMLTKVPVFRSIKYKTEIVNLK